MGEVVERGCVVSDNLKFLFCIVFKLVFIELKFVCVGRVLLYKWLEVNLLYLVIDSLRWLLKKLVLKL